MRVVLPVEDEDDVRLLCDCGVDRLETCVNFFERKRLAESEVKIFREAIVGKVAALQCGAPLNARTGLIRVMTCWYVPGGSWFESHEPENRKTRSPIDLR